MGANLIPFFQNQEVSLDIPDTPLPDYLRAADLHNLGNSGQSLISRAGEWFSSVGESIYNAPDFLKVSVLSGINSFYNSGLTVGRVLGMTEQDDRETSAYISSIDSNLGAYYDKDPAAADLGGFVLGSLLPGIGGIKVLNAGQKALNATKSGFVGTNIGAALGLRTPMIDTYIATAARDIANGQALYANLGASGVKALSTGIYQNVLEGIAFETAVQATMFKSPILQEQSATDIMWNVATGGLLNGAIGGAFHSASTIGKLNRAVEAAVATIRTPGSRALLTDTGITGLEISVMAKDLEDGARFFSSLDKSDPLYADQVTSWLARQERTNNAIRKATHALVTGSQDTLGNMVADMNVRSSADSILQRMADADEFTHVFGTTTAEKVRLKNVAQGIDAGETHTIQYIKLTGDDAGRVIIPSADNPGGPAFIGLGDLFAESNKSSIRERIVNFIKGKKFNPDERIDVSNISLEHDGYRNVMARWMWAGDKNMLKEIKPLSTIHRYDLPLLQRALDDGVLDITVVGESGQLIKPGFTSTTEMRTFVESMQASVAEKLFTKAVKKKTPFERGETAEEGIDWLADKISAMTNIRRSAIEGELRPGTDDFRAWQNHQSEYLKYLESKGLKPVRGEESDPRYMPTWVKVSKKIVDRNLPDGTVVDAMTWFEQQTQITQQMRENIVAKSLGELALQLPTITKNELSGAAVRSGTGATMFGFNNPGQGTLGSKASLIGSVTQRALIKNRQAFAELSEGTLANFGAKQEAVIEWGGINQKISRTDTQWGLVTLEDGTRGLVSQRAVQAVGKDMTIEDVLQGMSDTVDDFIPVNTSEAWELLNAHAEQTIKNTTTRKELAATRGKEISHRTHLDPEGRIPTFIPIRPDPKDYKHYVLVSDPKVTGQGHMSMIFAQTPEKLELLVRKAREARPDLEFRSASNTKDFYAARQAYEYDRTLSENYLDGALKKEGVYSDYYIRTDPQTVVDDYLSYHTRQIDTLTREVINTKYQPEFDWLRDQARHYGEFDTSKIGGNADAIEATSKNPYLSYIKTALNYSRAGENPVWYTVNRSADAAVSNVVDKVRDIFGAVKGTTWGPEAQAAEVATNALLQKYGMNTGYVTAATQLVVNSKIAQGELSKFVSGVNSLLARLVLGLDPLNALTNATGANILRMTELKQMLRAAAAKDAKIAGKLSELVELDVTGQKDIIWSATKLNAKGMEAYFKSLFGDKKEIDFFRQIGVIRDISDQFKTAIDNFTLRGSEVTQDLNPRLAKAKEIIDNISRKGEKWTGNTHAEEMNRFITAWGMKSLTDPLVAAGRMDLREQIAYINTHVNRVEGNMIASQRPFVFQGAIGQSIGLFQSYQFNLMQQMFRYVAEGSKKDAAMLLGLQGTFFGIQGLPAFQAINQHIIGNASGNREHRDLYAATYGVAGKNIGDMLMYGIPSNLLQTNMYSRGDINPRQVTIIPTALSEVPFVSATMKVYQGIKNTVSRLGAGGNVWETLLQGIEHTSINRPLSGFAQTLQATTGNGDVMSTTTQGSILFTNDLASLATASRLAGGRPLDEAIVNDMVFRVHSYNAYDQLKMKTLTAAVKSANINGQEMDEGSIAKFAEQYARNGGRLINFNRFMVEQIKASKTSQAERIVQDLKNPYSQRMQDLMGGGTSQTGNEFGE